MKRNQMALAAGVLGVALLLVGCGRETEKKLEATQQELTIATNDLAAAHAETALVKTQMEQRVGELQQNISRLTEEKAETEKQVSSLKSELEDTRRVSQEKMAQQEAKIDGLEQDKEALTKQIAGVRQDLADLERTHATTVAHLQAMREEYVKLTDANATLEAKLNNLKALKEQIRVVKQEMHEKRVEERKRLDRAEFAMGNHGYLLRDGSWVAPRVPGKYPLSQELHYGND
jgi:chromosome segregation ATPase